LKNTIRKEEIVEFRRNFKEHMGEDVALTDEDIIILLKELREKSIEKKKQLDEDLKRFNKDTEGENLLQIILRGHLYIEHEIGEIIKLGLKKPDAFLKSKPSFLTKLNLATASGIIPEENKDVYSRLNTLRNNYAHQLDYKLEKEVFDKFVDLFKVGKLEKFRTSVKVKDNYNLTQEMRNAVGVLWTYIKILNETEQYNSIEKKLKEIKEDIKMKNVLIKELKEGKFPLGESVKNKILKS